MTKIEENKSEMKSICKHKNLEWLGTQTMEAKKPLFLWNCKDCHTTISLTMKQLSEAIQKKLKSEVKYE